MSNFWHLNGKDHGSAWGPPKVIVLTAHHKAITDDIARFIERDDVWPLTVSAAVPCVKRLSEQDHGGIFQTVTIVYQEARPI